MCKQLTQRLSVIFLTVLASVQIAGCSYLHRRYGEQCKSHAYLENNLAHFVSTRFHTNSQVRMAIVPFSTEANLSPRGAEFPGISNELAWKVHARLLSEDVIPIVEVFNRQDWPAKKEEFFTGNFGALSMAREAGYDLVMVGLVERINSIDDLTAYTKIMDVESGITVWYGKSHVSSNHRDLDRWEDGYVFGDRDPSKLYQTEIVDRMAKCIVDAANDETNGDK